MERLYKGFRLTNLLNQTVLVLHLCFYVRNEPPSRLPRSVSPWEKNAKGRGFMVGNAHHRFLHFKLLGNPLHGFLDIFPTIESRNAEVAFTRSAKTGARCTHYIHRLQQFIEKVPTR